MESWKYVQDNKVLFSTFADIWESHCDSASSELIKSRRACAASKNREFHLPTPMVLVFFAVWVWRRQVRPVVKTRARRCLSFLFDILVKGAAVESELFNCLMSTLEGLRTSRDQHVAELFQQVRLTSMGQGGGWGLGGVGLLKLLG